MSNTNLGSSAAETDDTSLDSGVGPLPVTVSRDYLDDDADDYSSGGYDSRGDNADYTACSLECGYCGHCDY